MASASPPASSICPSSLDPSSPWSQILLPNLSLDTSPPSSSDSPTAMPLSSPNGSPLDSSSPVSKPPPNLLKSAWGKPPLDPGISPEPPAPVMGADSWPALSEARHVKIASEPSKSAPQRPFVKVPLSIPSAAETSQGSSLPRTSGNGSNFLNVRKHKTLTQQGTSSNGMSLTVPNSTDMAVSSTTSLKTPDEDRNSSTSRGTRNGTAVNQRGNASGGAAPNNAAGNRRNFVRDQGRGNHGWHPHARPYPNGRDTSNIPFQQQWTSPRNVPRPFIPYMNPTPPFVNAIGYQAIPGNMYYVPTPPPDRFVSPPYYSPPLFVQGPETIALQSVLVKQIEYYFSVENLCRDIFLRSNMDSQGFVPVSVIANFNRVRNLTNNVSNSVNFILDALRSSSVLEVQGGRIRKRDDWMNWLIPSRPSSVGGPLERDQNVFSPRPSGNTEDEVFSSGQNSNKNSECVESDASSFGGSLDFGGNASPIDVIQQRLDFRSSDDNNSHYLVRNSSKEPSMNLKDKSDSQSIELYSVE